MNGGKKILEIGAEENKKGTVDGKSRVLPVSVVGASACERENGVPTGARACTWWCAGG